MGNNDDLFNDDDLFGDDDFGDDGFGLGDDDLFADASSGSGGDDFGGFDQEFDGFGDDTVSDDFGFGDDDFGELEGGLDEDMDFGGGDDFGADDFAPAEEGGSSSNFPLIAGILGGVFVLLLLGILLTFLFGGDRGPSDIDLTTTAVVAINATTFAEGTDRAATANVEATQIVLAQSVTPTASPSPTNTRRPTFTPQPTSDPTEAALTEIAQAEADSETATASFLETEAASEPTQTPIPELDIEGTSTALAQTFLSITETFAARTPQNGEELGQGGNESGEATPTAEAVIGGGDTGNTGLTNTDQLPDAGLFDDFAAGNSLGIIALAAFGLLGVIAFSRRMRAANSETDE